jgi:hypothetical protein
VAIVDLLRPLLPGQLHLFGIDHNDEITDVGVGGEGRLVLAAKDLGHLRGEPPEDLVLGVHHVPGLMGVLSGEILGHLHRRKPFP